MREIERTGSQSERERVRGRGEQSNLGHIKQ